MKLSKIEFYFKFLSDEPGDLDEHMDVIREYASKSETIVELGVRKLVSTWALLAGYPKKIICVDNVHPRDYGAEGVLNDAIQSCKEEKIEFEFLLANDLEIELPEVDLLFIDTLHYYDQLTAELKLHANKAKKYIIFHDTELPEMGQAIHDFLKINKTWKIIEHHRNEHGLMVLGRK